MNNAGEKGRSIGVTKDPTGARKDPGQPARYARGAHGGSPKIMGGPGINTPQEKGPPTGGKPFGPN